MTHFLVNSINLNENTKLQKKSVYYPFTCFGIALSIMTFPATTHTNKISCVFTVFPCFLPACFKDCFCAWVPFYLHGWMVFMLMYVRYIKDQVKICVNP